MERRFLNEVLAGGVAATMLSAWGSDAGAQNTIQGRVKDENNRSVSFVQVQVAPGDRRVIADQNGEFVIAGFATATTN